MGVLLIVPAAPTVMMLEKSEVCDVETSKPSGAVIVMASFMFAPETVKFVLLDALPTVLLKAARLPVAVISAGTHASAWKPTTPLLLIVIVPSYMLVRAAMALPSASTPLMVPGAFGAVRIR